jgi:hypothetical protein
MTAMLPQLQLLIDYLEKRTLHPGISKVQIVLN